MFADTTLPVPAVAQISNLLYRRVVTCGAFEPTRDHLEVPAPRRFQIGDTAEYNSALPRRFS